MKNILDIILAILMLFLMGGSCPGSQYPAALRDPLPGNDHHPNVAFRMALYLK